MTEILVFGGTSEGRELAEWLSARGSCQVVACSATEFGGELVSGLPGVEALVGPLDADAKERLVADHDFACIVDATHPFATHVTESLAALAKAHGLPLLRVVREEGEVGGFSLESAGDGSGEGASPTAAHDNAIVVVGSVEEAARYVAQRPGRVLTTTGTKDLATYVAAIPDFADRLFVRVLPVPDSIANARGLGISAGNIVAMHGPFSVEFNCALMRELSIDVMVTKASGAAGGFPEKIEAAERCGVQAVVIGRPTSEEGFTVAEVKKELVARFGV